MGMSKATSIENDLRDVRALIGRAIERTVLSKLTADPAALVANGKMLRSRLIFNLGPAARVPRETLLHAAAALEMVHGASLLHDDVIDGGYLRRGVPTFWVEKGISGAILVGDMLLFKAVELMCEVEEGRLTPLLVRLTGEVCDAESEQELILRGKAPSWDNCVNIARRKTGALFAFAAGACAGNDATLLATLIESGYAVGTAYQLADDILDTSGNEELSGKSLGSDEARGKTAVGALSQQEQADAVAYIEHLCQHAEDALKPWPAVQQAWISFMNVDMRPALRKHTAIPSKQGA